MNLKIEIKIIDTDNDKVLFTDYSTGDSSDQRAMFSAAEANLGAMERHLPRVIAEEIKADEPDGEDVEDEDESDLEDAPEADPLSDEDIKNYAELMGQGSQTEQEAYRLSH